MVKILTGMQPFNISILSNVKLPTGKNKIKNNTQATVENKIDNDTNIKKDTTVLKEKPIANEISDMHDIMVAAGKVEADFELVAEIRNKIIEAYNEFMKMQV